jgi:hypothetical protein
MVFLTAPFLGTYIFLQYNRIEIRKEIAAKIYSGPDKKDLVLLKFTIEESETKLNWKHAGEFEYRGQMYDIVEKRQKGDSIWYSCYNDIKETRLNNELARLVNRTLGHDPYQKSQTDKLTDFFKTLFQQDAFIWKPYASLYSNFNFLFFIFYYSSLSFSPPSPPPKLG